jgi:hypothetical protein
VTVLVPLPETVGSVPSCITRVIQPDDRHLAPDDGALAAHTKVSQWPLTVKAVDDVRARMISLVMNELEELEASAAVAAALPSSRRRGAGGPSDVFTLRLDRDELNALELRLETAMDELRALVA